MARAVDAQGLLRGFPYRVEVHDCQCDVLTGRMEAICLNPISSSLDGIESFVFAASSLSLRPLHPLVTLAIDPADVKKGSIKKYGERKQSE